MRAIGAGRWRATGRLALRQVRRSRASSALVVALVALPIIGLTAVAVFVDSQVATPEEAARAELGRMAAWISPVGGPGTGMSQDPRNPLSVVHLIDADADADAEPRSDADPRSDIDGVLPGGTTAIPVSRAELRIDTPAGAATVPAWGGEVWDDRFSGAFELVEGRAPRSDDEVLVTAATLDRLDAVIGGSLTETSTGRISEIVGVFSAAPLSSDQAAVVVPDAARFTRMQWYLPDLELSWSDVRELNAAGIVAYSRAVVLDPPSTRSDGAPFADGRLGVLWQLVVGLAVGGAFAGYVVVMLAGAAFAVSARRQQRTLAIAASVGADARDIRRIVLLQGAALGLGGGVVGVGGGIALAAAVMAATSDGSATQFWGFHVPWAVLAGILVFAGVVGTGAALLPARAIARTDVVGALRGARHPQPVRVSRPLWGSLVLVSGAALTIASGLAAAAVANDPQLSWDSPLRWLPVIGLTAGPVIAQLGIVLSGRWLLWIASRALSRCGVAARLASRDAVANGSRTVPAFAAIGATVFVGVFAAAVATMTAAQSAATWAHQAPVGRAVVWAGPSADGTDVADDHAIESAQAARELLREAGAEAVAMVGAQRDTAVPDVDDLPADVLRAVAVTPSALLAPRDGSVDWRMTQSPENNLSIVAIDDVQTATGVDLSAQQRRAYEGGSALVLDPRLIADGGIEVAAWPERDWRLSKDDGPEAVKAPDNMFEPEPGRIYASPVWTRRLDAIEVDGRGQGLSVLIAPDTADALGIRHRPNVVIAAFPTPLAQADQDRVHAIADAAPSDAYTLEVHIEAGPPDELRWLGPLLVAVSVLVVGASSVALGLARFERRPDDATLAAVGGGSGLRRAIGFWQGLVIAGFGTAAGAVGGTLPAVGLWLQSRGNVSGSVPLDLADVPWVAIALLVVALPLAIAAANAIVPPRRADLTRRTAIT